MLYKCTKLKKSDSQGLNLKPETSNEKSNMAVMSALVLVHFNQNREVALIFFFQKR